jgi:hypothetical protein
MLRKLMGQSFHLLACSSFRATPACHSYSAFSSLLYSDRAILEHEITRLQSALSSQKAESFTSLTALTSSHASQLASLQVELDAQRLALVEAETHRQVAQDDLARVAVSEGAQREEIEELRRVAERFRETDERLLGVLRGSSLGQSLSLPPLVAVETAKKGETAEEQGGEGRTGGVEGAGPAEELAGYDLRFFEETMLKTMKLVRSWQKKYLECVILPFFLSVFLSFELHFDPDELTIYITSAHPDTGRSDVTRLLLAPLPSTTSLSSFPLGTSPRPFVHGQRSTVRIFLSLLLPLGRFY